MHVEFEKIVIFAEIRGWLIWWVDVDSSDICSCNKNFFSFLSEFLVTWLYVRDCMRGSRRIQAVVLYWGCREKLASRVVGGHGGGRGILRVPRKACPRRILEGCSNESSFKKFWFLYKFQCKSNREFQVAWGVVQAFFYHQYTVAMVTKKNLEGSAGFLINTRIGEAAKICLNQSFLADDASLLHIQYILSIS